MKYWLGIFFKVSFSAAVTAYILRGIDFEIMENRLAVASIPLIIGSTVVLSFQYIIASIRWQIVLKMIGAKICFAKILRLIFIGAFFNQILPGSIGGDAVRVYKAHKAGLSVTTSLNSVLLERIATLLGLFLLVSLSLIYASNLVLYTDLLWLVFLVVFSSVTGLIALMFLDHLPEKWKTSQFISKGIQLSIETRTVFLQPVKSTCLLLLCVIGHVNIVLGVWILGIAIGLESQLSLIDCMMLIPPVLLLTMLPISMAGWGVREASMVTALGLINITPESALLLSIVFGLQTLAIALLGGLVWVFSSDVKNIKY